MAARMAAEILEGAGLRMVVGSPAKDRRGLT